LQSATIFRFWFDGDNCQSVGARHFKYDVEVACTHIRESYENCCLLIKITCLVTLGHFEAICNKYILGEVCIKTISTLE